MAKIDIKFAELQTPLFLGGKNHGLKLDIDKYNIKMVEDEEKDKLFIYYNGEVSRTPLTNVANSVAVDSKPTIAEYFSMSAVPTPKNVAPAPVVRGKIRAQASTPMDHVHADAPGKVRD